MSKVHICKAPFCENSKKYTKSAYCGKHEWERTKFNVKAFKEVLPLWSIKRCKIHGLLKPSEVQKRKDRTAVNILYTCKYCLKPSSYKPTDSYKETRQDRFLVKRYGIDRKQYEETLKNQDYSCAICKLPNFNFDTRTGKNRKMAVDHCHETKKVRGILCFKCNMGLGSFKDDIFLLEKAIKYLRPHKEA